MDYEFRIKQAEADLAHLQTLQALSRGRLDAHDSSLESLTTITRQTAVNLDVLTVQVGRLEVKIDKLVDALLHNQTRNGGASGKA